MKKNKYSFEKLPVPYNHPATLTDVYIAFKNEKSKVLSALESLQKKERDDILDIINRLAMNTSFDSPKIRYSLTNYSFSEIKSKHHRVFFFKKGEQYIVFFHYKTKKQQTFPSKIYKAIEKEKREYEEEFLKSMKKNLKKKE